jgi:hypothetical protein
MKKLTYRKRIGKYLFYAFFTKTENTTGVTSYVKDDKNHMHYVLWDFDKTPLVHVINELMYVSKLYELKNIVIMSDKKDSYRAFSPTKVDFRTLMKILLDTEFVDWEFIKWTMRRGYATIRMTKKEYRKKPKIIEILKYDGRYKPDLNDFVYVDYEGDCDKLI